ncbi:MAG: DEAD/DEAH box helicase family protein, partial [Bacteroidia bacterium]|nr:DEAD/DEAH box helicase family protein [Bacteroidia bacterium]
WKQLHRCLALAEQRVYTEPVSSGQYSRLALETCVHQIYRLESMGMPYNDSLSSLLQQPDFQALAPRHLLDGVLGYTLKTGNRAAHYGKQVQPEEALRSLRYLYAFVKWFARDYSQAEPDLPGAFDERFIPRTDETARQLAAMQAELERARQEAAEALAREQALRREREEAARESEAARAAYEAALAAQRAELESRKARRRSQPLAAEYTEAETRSHLIDAALRDAGWTDLRPGYELEFPVKGMPLTRDNPRGNGFADYVLWSSSGLPLAVIEAKRASASEAQGLHQASLYADCLEQMYGQRPVIFVSNGLRIQIWDDAFYSAPRLVYGFYSRDDLEWLVQQRRTRQDLRHAGIDARIAGRAYQQEGIRRILESLAVEGSGGLRGHKRAALMVMATGAGKTRTAAALVEVLMRMGWVRRTLFLADRNALVTQAKKSFAEQLPHVTAIDLTQEQEDETTRLVFSTYPTMMNQIDAARLDGGSRRFGTGHFDLILIDEAHRSIYDRYQAIFAYFDALVVGMTATPIDFIDRSTFSLFDCPSGDPTFHFPLDEAVRGGFLVPPAVFSIPTRFTRAGIAYQDLTPEDQRRYEETFRDEATGWFPEEIGQQAINQWLFNEDTVDKVLDRLMAEGLRIEGGDRIGRTIIFAVNQRHAEFVAERFRRRYPELPGDSIAVIHTGVSHAQRLIEAFCDAHTERHPRIAVSVDMMDTGVDAPRVLNLVFFKVVRSRAKFEQMIGRGTRLCPDMFGPGQHKTTFYVFDVCQNFEFFGLQTDEREPVRAKPLSQEIFNARLQVSALLMATGEAGDLELARRYRDLLHGAIAALDPQRFQVQMQFAWVDRYRRREAWDQLTPEDLHEISERLSPLPVPEAEDDAARWFDLLMLKLQHARLLTRSTERYTSRLVGIAEQLGDGTRYGIPEVARARPLIESMKDPDWYASLTQTRLEEIRATIRELVQYLSREGRGVIYTNLQDEIGPSVSREWLPGYGTSAAYRGRVAQFIRENRHHLTIRKLHTNEPITALELEELERLLFERGPLESRAQYEAVYGPQPLGAFVRSILGMRIESAQEAFAEFTGSGTLRADQLRFIQLIIDYLTQNGVIDKQLLFQPPFTDAHEQGPFGLFDEAQIIRMVRILDQVNANAMAS